MSLDGLQPGALQLRGMVPAQVVAATDDASQLRALGLECPRSQIEFLPNRRKMAAQVGASRYQPAWGRNKKEAEQRAARNALSELAGQTPPFPSDS